MAATPQESLETRSVLGWAVGVGAAAPFVIAATSAALVAAWWNELPAVVPHHWGASGQPDAFGGRGSFYATIAVVCLALPALMAAFTFPGLAKGSRGFAYRLLPAMALAISGLGAVISAGVASLHRDVPEGGPWPNINGMMLAGFALAVALGLGGYFVQPRQRAARHGLHPLAHVDVAPGERVAWIRTTSIARWFLALLVVLGVVICAGAASLLATGPVGAGVALAVAAVVIALAAGTSTSFRVTVDGRGLRAVSAAGWPRFAVPLAEVETVAVVDVNGLGEFGGYGLRSAPGADGVILRNGEAIEVTKKGGRRFLVTVDDAATGAALLASLAEARRATDGEA